jgi:Glycosyltransferases involved in cell wall biogenesis
MDKTLVSIVVITYNSSNYICETLDSIHCQTYKNIELIITDDCSTDDTIYCCEKWIKEKGERFHDIKLIPSTKNLGIPANCNKGIAACEGEWIKLIAGDDILLKDCITSNLAFIQLNSSQRILFLVSDMISFLDWDYMSEENMGVFNPRVFGKHLNVGEQYKEVLKGFFGNSPTFFVHKKVYEFISYDESYPFMEDYPFVLNVLKHGIKIHHMESATVRYRIRNNSAYNEGVNLIFSSFYRRQRVFDKNERLPFMSFSQRVYENTIYYKKLFFDRLRLNSKNRFNIFLFVYIDRLNPFYLYNKVKEILK